MAVVYKIFPLHFVKGGITRTWKMIVDKLHGAPLLFSISFGVVFNHSYFQ